MPAVLEKKKLAHPPTEMATDSFARVKSAMDQVLAVDQPEAGIIKSVLADIKSLIERAERVRRLSPELAGVEVSPYVYKMLKMADQIQQQ